MSQPLEKRALQDYTLLSDAWSAVLEARLYESGVLGASGFMVLKTVIDEKNAQSQQVLLTIEHTGAKESFATEMDDLASLMTHLHDDMPIATWTWTKRTINGTVETTSVRGDFKDTFVQNVSQRMQNVAGVLVCLSLLFVFYTIKLLY